jgi:hypothetical protein
MYLGCVKVKVWAICRVMLIGIAERYNRELTNMLTDAFELCCSSHSMRVIR